MQRCSVFLSTIEELDRLIKHKNIVNYIKAQRLSWFGHVQRMSVTRTVKKIFDWKPLTKISQGRPKYRWEDNIKQDICQMKVKNWTACIQDREKWKKEVVEKAKISAIKESSVPGRRRSVFLSCMGLNLVYLIEEKT